MTGSRLRSKSFRRSIRFTAQGIQQTAHFVLQGGTVHLDLNGLVAAVSETTHEAGPAERQAGSARLLAPMNGAIISVLAKPGDRVGKGQRIVVLEAMKMQHEISAEREGTIARILVNPGDQVATRQLLAELVPEEAQGDDVMSDKAVITCALTGVLTDPKRHPVPVTPKRWRVRRRLRSTPALRSCTCISVNRRRGRGTCRPGSRSLPRPLCRRSGMRARA